jgi:hypothetical protein
MGPHCLGASEKAGCVSDFMSNPLHNIKLLLCFVWIFSTSAQVRPRGIAGAGGGGGQEVPPPQAAEFKRQANEYFK